MPRELIYDHVDSHMISYEFLMPRPLISLGNNLFLTIQDDSSNTLLNLFHVESNNIRLVQSQLISSTIYPKATSWPRPSVAVFNSKEFVLSYFLGDEIWLVHVEIDLYAKTFNFSGWTQAITWATGRNVEQVIGSFDSNSGIIFFCEKPDSNSTSGLREVRLRKFTWNGSVFDLGAIEIVESFTGKYSEGYNEIGNNRYPATTTGDSTGDLLCFGWERRRSSTYDAMVTVVHPDNGLVGSTSAHSYAYRQFNNFYSYQAGHNLMAFTGSAENYSEMYTADLLMTVAEISISGVVTTNPVISIFHDPSSMLENIGQPGVYHGNLVSVCAGVFTDDWNGMYEYLIEVDVTDPGNLQVKDAIQWNSVDPRDRTYGDVYDTSVVKDGIVLLSEDFNNNELWTHLVSPYVEVKEEDEGKAGLKVIEGITFENINIDAHLKDSLLELP